jgi:hypothetical protein
LVSFGLLNAASTYGSSTTDMSRNISVYLGVSAHQSTFVRRLKEIASPERILVTARAAIANDEYVIAIYDNAQKGQQPNGSPNQFWKGTARTLLKFYNPMERGETISSAYVIPITYEVNHAIPSPTGMPCFEKWDNSCLNKSTEETNFDDKRNEEVNIVDTTGIRVKLYLSFLDSEELISLWRYLSILEAPSWLSDNFKTDLRQKTINSLHTLRSRAGLFAAARLFQRNVANLWRGRKPTAEVLPMPISLEDETTTKGNGKIVVELAYLAGFLSRDNTTGSWVVPENVCNRYLFLVGDALSIVRCLSFQRDLLQREGRSFCTCYKERQVIRKALNQMVIIPGDLHEGGFHQYTLFYPAFL